MAGEPNPEPATSWSRYQRVKQILNDAAGDSAPSYQGHERFWNLPLHESWPTYWWPAHRPVQVNNQPWSPTAQNNAGDLAMVTAWSSLSFVAKNPEATVENMAPALVMVEPIRS